MSDYNDAWYNEVQAARAAVADPEVGCAVAQVHALLALALAVIKVQDRLQELTDAK